MMIFLCNEDKPRNAEDYDRFVCAELPNPKKMPRLYELVKKFMIHGPCETIVKTGPACLDEKGLCTKNYPKPLQRETLHSEHHYPAYRRRGQEHGGHTAMIPCRHIPGLEIQPDGKRQIPEIELNNSWVVPYNPMLMYR